MTGEELERAIDFLLKSQANLESQAARTDEQISQLAARFDTLADTQTNLIRVYTQTLEEQGRINASLRAADAAQARLSESLFESARASRESQARINESLGAAIAELAAKQGRTEEALTKLTMKVDALVEIVGEGRGGGG